MVNVRFDTENWGGEGPHWDRIRATMRHGVSDRIPITAWRHFPGFEQDAEAMARAHLAFQMRFGFDVLILTPRFGFTAIPWGYDPGDELDEYGHPLSPISDGSSLQWEDIGPTSANGNYFDEVLRAIKLIKRNLKVDVPLLVTVYGPLTTAWFLRGEQLREAWAKRDDPVPCKAFLNALDAIDQSIRDFIREVLTVADGVYYISYFASLDHFRGRAEAVIAMERDLAPLRDLQSVEKLIGIHLHGNELLYDEALEFPVDVVSWHDRWVKPSLRDARMKTEAVLMGGINEADTMHRETPAAIALQIGDAVNQVEGKGLIVAPGGPVHLDTPGENLRASVAILRDLA